MRGAVATVLLALPVHAKTDPFYPAAQCAAYWLGRNDFAAKSAFLDSDATDVIRADAFRAVAIRQNGGDAAPIDDFLDSERSNMALMIEAAIYRDRISDRLQRRLLVTCADFAATQDETRALP